MFVEPAERIHLPLKRRAHHRRGPDRRHLVCQRKRLPPQIIYSTIEPQNLLPTYVMWRGEKKHHRVRRCHSFSMQISSTHEFSWITSTLEKKNKTKNPRRISKILHSLGEKKNSRNAHLHWRYMMLSHPCGASLHSIYEKQYLKHT